MDRLHSLLLLTTLQLGAASLFPKPLQRFAEDPTQKGTRWFSHSEKHFLDSDHGGTILSVNWRTSADPDSILALDLEHRHGVKLVSCNPDYLVLHLPASHVPRASTWKHIVASDALHRCEHLVDHPLYHRVEKMEFTKHPETPKGGATAVFSTKELYSVSQVLPHVEFNYGVTPIDALHPDEQEEARKMWEAGRREQLQARRLQLNLAPVTNGDAPATVAETVATPTTGTVATPTTGTAAVSNLAAAGSPMNFNLSALAPGLTNNFKHSVGQITMTNQMDIDDNETDVNTIANWKPMSHANFGWNFNYHTNATRNPQFKFELPGMHGYILLKNPYMRFIGDMNIKFSSEWNATNPFASPPIVIMNASLNGNVYINADLGLMANIYRDVSEDPFGRFDIPLLNDFTKETHFFQRVHFFIGGLPCMIQPGVSVNLNAYHLGLFKGAVRLGVNTHLYVQANMIFDDTKPNPFAMDFKAAALNVKLLPPTWMIYTKHLEFGALLTPAFWLRGGIGPVRDMTLEAQLRPYCNISITQEGESSYGIQQQVMEKELIVVPFRAINLPIGESWSVGIQANGRKIMTSTELSLGVTEFNDYVEHFRFGLMDQRRLMAEPIYVSVFKDGTEQASTIVSFHCESLVEGQCQPAPYNAQFTVNGKNIIVQLIAAWHARPLPFLMSKVRAMSLVFPQIALSADASRDYQANVPESVFIKISKNGREYTEYVTPKIIHDHLVQLETHSAVDLGLQWIYSWNLDFATISGSDEFKKLINPKVEIFYVRSGATQLAGSTYVPSIDWYQVIEGAGSDTSENAVHDDNTYQQSGWANNNNVWSAKQASSGVGRVGSHAYGGVEGPGRGSDWQGIGSSEHIDGDGRRLGDERRLVLNRGDPAEVWQDGFFEGNVPLNLLFAESNGQSFGDGHMGLDVHAPLCSNRWVRPYRTETWVEADDHHIMWTTRGSCFGDVAGPPRPGVNTPGGRRLAPWWKGFTVHNGHKYPWESHERDVPHKQTFDLIFFKVDANGEFVETAANFTLVDMECSYTNPVAKSYEAYGDQCIYSRKVEGLSGVAGSTIVFQLKFTDKTDGTQRTMFSAPVKFVTALATTATQSASGVAVMPNPGTARKLSNLHKEDGVMVDSPPDSDKEMNIKLTSLPVQKSSSHHSGNDDKPPARKLTGFLDADAMEDKESGWNAFLRQLQVATETLNAPEVIPHQVINNGQYGYQRVNSNISFNDRMQELHPICTRKPLHYEVGAGIFFRMKLHNFEIPGTANLGVFSTLSNLASFANMDTLDIPLAKTALGKKFEELLPKEFCSEGVCDGTLPGCPGQTVHPITIPKVEFRFDRTFQTNTSSPESKKAAAFAMALLPEFVRISSIVIGSFWKKQAHPPHFFKGSYYHTGNVVYYNGNRCRYEPVSTCVQTFEYRSTDYQGCTMQDHKQNEGWCSVDRQFIGNWRSCNLLCNNPDGTTSLYAGKVVRGHVTIHPTGGRRLSDEEEEPHTDGAVTDRMLLEFVKPEEVQYKVDEDLIHTLIRRKAFRGMAGDREIVAFRLHRDGSEPTDDETGMIRVMPDPKYETGLATPGVFEVRNEEKFATGFNVRSYVTKLSAPSSPLPLTTIVAGVAIFAIASLLAGAYRIKKRSVQVPPYATVAEEEISAED